MKIFIKKANLQLKIGIILLVIVFIFAFIMPLFSEVSPEAWNTFKVNLRPSSEHFFGTNAMGQDIFWLLAKSIQTSLIIGVVVGIISIIIGVFLGMLAGFSGGFLDRFLSLCMDTFITIPVLPILMLVASLYQGRATIFDISVMLVIFNWAWPARQARAMVLSLRERDFIDTARFSGEGKLKILVSEVLPFILGWSVASFIHTILNAIRTESSLAVVGMSNSSWATLGTMIYWANIYSAMLQGRWLWIGAPVVATVLVFFALFMTLSGAQKYNALKRGTEA